MFIEKLSDKDIENIFKTLVSVIESNKEIVNKYYKNSKLRTNDNAIIIEFYTGKEWEYCYLKDFRASVSINFNFDKKVVSTYRKLMYKKFGNEYYNYIRDFYRKDIAYKYDKELENLSNELNEMIK